ncbi:MAG: hypothetical protein K8R02_05695 [Anaerohalosphaeraceae bacterium]|nr:hypothetical protein [Anaerohalosphaeraceae bacterium]
MNNRSGWMMFLLFIFLTAMLAMQFLGMLQSDRLYVRLNTLIDNVSDISSGSFSQPTSNDDVDSYPGDDGDWLVEAFPAEVRTLNLLSVNSDMNTRDIVSGLVIETLFEQDPDSDKTKLRPKLAESMDISDDGLEITVTLKENTHFSDGVAVTAEDVIFTYKTIMNQGIDCADLRGYYENFTGIEKIDNRTVKFTVSERYWKTIPMIGSMYVFPKHIYDFNDPKEFNDRNSNPIGSGPYVFEKWSIGQSVVLKRNESYWGKKPKIKKRVFKFIKNAVATLQALRSGEVDIFEPGSDQVTDLPKDPDFAKNFRTIIIWEPTFGYWYIGWNQQREFFKDKRCRQAMTCIMDREVIVEKSTRGNGRVISGPFYINGAQNNPTIKPWPYDLNKAAELLDAVGWIDTDDDGIRDKNGIPFSFKFSYLAGNTSAEEMARLLKDNAAKVGVDVIADPAEWSVFIERLNAGKFDAMELMWGGVIEADPHQIFHSSQIAGRGNNRVHYRSDIADELIEKARRELDEEKRYALYHKLHSVLHDDQPYTFLMTRPRYYFIDRRFENVIVHKLGVDQLEWYVPKNKQRYK